MSVFRKYHPGLFALLSLYGLLACGGIDNLPSPVPSPVGDARTGVDRAADCSRFRSDGRTGQKDPDGSWTASATGRTLSGRCRYATAEHRHRSGTDRP